MRKIDGNDLVAFIGLILLGIGLYLAWAPLAFIIVGLVLLIVGILGAIDARIKAKQQQEQSGGGA